MPLIQTSPGFVAVAAVRLSRGETRPPPGVGGGV
jgi:hypothetical protein